MVILIQRPSGGGWWLNRRGWSGLGTEIAAQLRNLETLSILYATGNSLQLPLTSADGIACLTKLLEGAQLCAMLFQVFLIVLLQLIYGLNLRRPFSKVDLVVFPNAKIF